MSRFSPTVLPNYGQAVGTSFAGAIRGIDYADARKRQEEQDERQAELDALMRRRYNVQEAGALADLADRNVVTEPPTMQAREQATPEQSQLFDGARMGMKSIGQEGPSPLAVAGSPNQLASILQAQEPVREPEIAVRAGQFVPGQGFAATNIFRQQDQRELSTGVRGQEYTDPQYQRLGDTGFWRGPQEEEGFRYEGNKFPNQEAYLDFAGRLARAEYPQRFVGEEQPDGSFIFNGERYDSKADALEFFRQQKEIEASFRTGAEARDPLTVQRYMFEARLVGDVREFLNEKQRFRTAEPEALDALVEQASGGYFQTYAEFSERQRLLAAEGGMTSAAGGNVGFINPGGDGEGGGGGDGGDSPWTDEELDAALEEAGWDIEKAEELLLSRSRGG